MIKRFPFRLSYIIFRVLDQGIVVNTGLSKSIDQAWHTLAGVMVILYEILINKIKSPGERNAGYLDIGYIVCGTNHYHVHL